MTIHLIRHTSVDVDFGICYGQSDVPLKDTFSDEATVVKNNLDKLPNPDVVFSSPLSRCTKLAHFCGYKDATLDDRLKEFSFGDWELKRWKDLNVKDWQNNWFLNPPPNGESLPKMYERVANFLDELKKENHSVVYIFAHAGVINCAKTYFGQTTLEEAFNNPIPYGGIATFEF